MNWRVSLVAVVWDSLADALEQEGKADEALASSRKAVSLAEASGDPSVETFRKHAARLAARYVMVGAVASDQAGLVRFLNRW